MIYETSYVVRTDASEEAIKKLKESVAEVIASANGEVLISDDWGVKTFAQPTERGIKRGHYFYFMYRSNTQANAELERRFKISEDVIRFIVIKLGTEQYQADIVKNYKSLNASSSEAASDQDKDRKSFSKRRSCWFSAKKTSPDWKDPSSYAWLVNEFGKISPARVSGLRPIYQRMANASIKRGRVMGLIGNMSNEIAR